jgi:hypothetical protein
VHVVQRCGFRDGADAGMDEDLAREGGVVRAVGFESHLAELRSIFFDGGEDAEPVYHAVDVCGARGGGNELRVLRTYRRQRMSIWEI